MSALLVQSLVHHYGRRQALAGIDLAVASGEIFGLLGPNGSGKTTLFRLLSTLIPVQQGTIAILSCDVTRATHAVRRLIGVVFQSPSLDKKLSVAENLLYQGRLYGLSGASLRSRRDELLERFRLTDRRRDLVETLSGGLRRRVELAKGLLHQPRLLLLDEPTTGLDPAARADLWDYLRQAREQHGITVLLTTHLLEDAEKADRLAIFDAGRIVALGTPDHLRAQVGGDTLTITTAHPAELARDIAAHFHLAPAVMDGAVRLQQPDAHQLVPRLVEAFPNRIQSIALGKPTLEDVFIARTGHRLHPEVSRAN